MEPTPQAAVAANAVVAESPAGSARASTAARKSGGQRQERRPPAEATEGRPRPAGAARAAAAGAGRGKRAWGLQPERRPRRTREGPCLGDQARRRGLYTPTRQGACCGCAQPQGAGGCVERGARGGFFQKDKTFCAMLVYMVLNGTCLRVGQRCPRRRRGRGRRGNRGWISDEGQEVREFAKLPVSPSRLSRPSGSGVLDSVRVTRPGPHPRLRHTGRLRRPRRPRRTAQISAGGP